MYLHLPLPVFFVVFLSAIPGAPADTQPLTVTVLNGTLSGARCPSTDVNSFLSIPYANPPLGDLRFAPPQVYDEKYDGVLNATTPAPACPQFSIAFNESTVESEDCLFIDVWAPANATVSSALPVRVWVFGGADVAGGISNPLYDGCFASTDSIQVSINYRVGPLGFLVDEGLGLTGNYGIQDLLLGLQWVQDNIASFGGDPTRVLLFGQSAGATNSRIISGLPQAPSLFHAAVLESGNYRALPNLTAATQANAPYIASLDCAGNVACLRSTPVGTLVARFVANAAQSLFGLVVDGTTIPAAPTHPLVPSIIGSVGAEGTLFVVGEFLARGGVLSLNESAYVPWLEGFAAVEGFSSLSAPDVTAINETYPVSRFADAINPTFAAMSAVLTDSYFRCPAQQVAASAAAAGVPVWTYSFNHTPSCAWSKAIPQNWRVLELLGAAHTSELPFVFGQLTNLPHPSGACSLTADEVALSATMRTHWDHMASDATPAAGWPAYNASTSMGINVLNSTAEWQSGTVDYSMCAFWDKILGVGLVVPDSSNGTGNSSSPNGSSMPTGTGGGSGSGSSSAMNAMPNWAYCTLLAVMVVALETFW
ncbi:hypothetical protein SEUCBS139899_009511 [Sporothrix eucalyptigena]